MLGRTGFVAIAMISAVVGAHSLNPREIYDEMYPIETLKRDAFHICHDADPTFVRAVKVDREACYDSMPHAIEVALGRIRAGGVLTMAALLDPAHQNELLQIIATAPRQPVTVPRSFANTEWARALSPGCAGAGARSPTAVALAAPGLPPPPGSGRAAALNGIDPGNLPALAHAETSFAWQPTPLTPGTSPSPMAAAGDPTATASALDPLSSPDLGDKGPPAIVPIAAVRSCGGA